MRARFSTQQPHRPGSALSNREQLLRRHDVLKASPSLAGASGYLGRTSRGT
jgi:hypothetical protein